MSHSLFSVCPARSSEQQDWRPASVCWELIDSASYLAKGPAMVLSLCPACSRAGGVGRDTGSWGKMEVWLEGTDWKRREGGGGGLEWKHELGAVDGGQREANLHERWPRLHPLPPATTTPNHPPGGTEVILCGIGAFQCSSFSWLRYSWHAGSQNPIFGFSFHHQWNGIWWIWYKEEIWVCVYPAAQNQFYKPHWRLINMEWKKNVFNLRVKLQLEPEKEKVWRQHSESHYDDFVFF